MEKITVKTMSHPEGRVRGSGTGGGRQRREAVKVACSGNCGSTSSPTDAGAARVQIRHARPIFLCVACTIKALATIDITLEVVPQPPTLSIDQRTRASK